MIRIACTNCKTILSIDDAFAGGVCRCQHCGTIQTVPAQARDTADVAASGQSIGGAKAQYQSSDSRTGTGMDDLVGAIVSSGLSSSRLTQPLGSTEPTKKSVNLMPIFAAVGVVVAVLVLVIIYLATRTTSIQTSSPGDNAANTGGQTNPSIGSVVVTKAPNFCGNPLNGNTVIYLLDCGVATQEFLGELKDATLKSLESLGSDHKFQIMFWNNGSDGAYPEGSTTYATKESLDAATKAIDDVTAFGQTDVKAALQLAMVQHPDEIIMATGKGWSLDNAWLDEVLAIRGSAPVKIDTYSLGSDGESAPLKTLAAKTGGTYHEMTRADLRSFGQ